MLLPRSCPVCGRHGEAPCGPCRATLEPPPNLATPPGLVACHAAFAYVGSGRELVARLKYRNNRSALSWLAAQMAAQVRPGLPPGALVTWAPTTRQHRRERGFDHAALLARAVARELQLPVRCLLTRLPGPPQTGRSRTERACGPQFAPRPRPTPGSAAVVARPVLLVDDVSTTGATLAGAARALHGGVLGPVIGVVAARTP